MAAFTEEERAVDDALGYPMAYARLCRAGTGGGALGLPYAHGPLGAFLPYVLQPHEALRAKDLNEMFPVVDAEVAHTTNPRGFTNLDPALFRVDAYGNVLYLHADSASPLAWDVHHWFPCADAMEDAVFILLPRHHGGRRPYPPAPTPWRTPLHHCSDAIQL